MGGEIAKLRKVPPIERKIEREREREGARQCW
jgi:hypothetical protein